MGGFTIPRGFRLSADFNAPGVSVVDSYGGQRVELAPGTTTADLAPINLAVSQAVNANNPALAQRNYRDFVDRSALDYAEIERRQADSNLNTAIGLLSAVAMPYAAPALGSLFGGGLLGSAVGGGLIGGATAAATGDSIVEGVLTGGLSGGLAGVSIDPNVQNVLSRAEQAAVNPISSLLSALSAAGPSVIEQVFSDQDYRDGGVIPEQPFETQAPIVPPTEAGGGGSSASPAPAPAPAPSPTPSTPGPDVDPEQPYRYEGDGRFVNVLTGEIINRIVPDTFVIGDFYGLPQNVETNVPEPAPPTPAPEPTPPEEVVDVFLPPDLVVDTTAPDTFEPTPVEAPVTPVEPVTPTPMPTPMPPVEQPVEPVTEPVQQPEAGTDESVAVGGEGTGTGEGVGAGEGEGEGDGSGDGMGLGAGLMAAAAGAAFEPQWNKLFKYTTLTPYQKKTLAPYVDYIAQAKGMLS